jgi:hypothetical protein
MAAVDVNVGVSVSLPSIVISSPPPVVVVPGTYVYVIPDIEADIVFYHDYWYRPFKGGWYRSQGYNGPWGFIARERVPGVLFKLPSDVRRVPPGQARIPYGQLKKSWRTWEKEKHWEKDDLKHDAKEIKHEEKEMRREEKESFKGGRGKGKH